MTTLTKTLLTVSVAGLVTGSFLDFGIVNLQPLYTVFLPAGAVFFELFLISLFLEKSAAAYDREETEKLRSIQPKAARPVRNANRAPVTNSQAVHG